MTQIRLIPSTHYLSNTNYLSVSNANNMYNNTNNASYATVTNSQNGTTSYYIYLRGFNFSSIPSNAIINSFTIKLKAYENGVSTSTNYRPYLCNGTTQITNAYSNVLSTNVQTLTFSNGSMTWETLKGYGDNFGIRINCRRSNRNTTSYVYIYGAEIEVDYTIPIYHQITAINNTDLVESIIPEGLTNVLEGDDYSLKIYADTFGDFTVEDNGVDVTEDLQYEIPQEGTQEFTGIPVTYDSENSFYDSIYTGSTSDGLAPSTSTSRICAFVSQTNYAEAKLIYNFDCSSIPQNATITSVTCVAAAACYSNGQYFDTKTLQLYNGNTAKGSAVTITGNGNTPEEHNINGGQWTRNELNDIKIVVYIKRGSDTTQASFSFWGATLTVNYTIPSEPYYEYTLTNVNDDHEIVVRESIYIPPEEDPEIEYHSLTISSINATTTPKRGTTRVESGDSETITIYPDDPQITLILDNGVDVSSQLVAHGRAIENPVVSTAQGASYGFVYSSSTGYYISNNKGVDKSAAVCRIDFDLPVRCLVTIEYINYAEATYDFGVFGNIDSPLSNNYYEAGSNGATITDNDYKLACNTSSYNSSSPQTITYEIPSGEHYINIKFSKDDATSSNNDTIQWKIVSIEPLEANNYYTYTLNNINQDHSLVFIFGDVTYYFVNSSLNGNGKINPNGQMIQLPGDSYRLTIVPTNNGDTITITDNNVDVTSKLERKEVTTEKDGQTITVVNYIYRLSNIQETHNLVVSSVSQGLSSSIKLNNQWNEGELKRKQDNEWETVSYTRIWVHNGTAWIENTQRTITTNGMIFGGVINNGGE